MDSYAKLRAMTAKPPWMTPSGVRAPRSGRMPEARREDLLQRLEDLLLAEGFARLTVDDMAGRLQCSKSTLYTIASSKEQLVAAAVRHFFRDATARIEDKLTPVAGAAQRVLTYVAAVGAELDRMSAEFYADMVTSDLTAGVYERNSEAAARRVRELVEAGSAAGEFREVDAGFVGAAASLLIDGIRHGQLLARTGLSAEQAYDQLGQLVVSAVNRDSAATPVRSRPSAR